MDPRELIAESKGGGNDHLAAMVANAIGADLLILLTDTEGLHTANPKKEDKAELVTRVEKITPEVYSWAGEGDDPKHESNGGMLYKLKTSETYKGDIVIANGIPENGLYRVIHDIVTGEPIGTYFMRQQE